jgi:hypothetical protein
MFLISFILKSYLKAINEKDAILNKKIIKKFNYNFFLKIISKPSNDFKTQKRSI